MESGWIQTIWQYDGTYRDMYHLVMIQIKMIASFQTIRQGIDHANRSRSILATHLFETIMVVSKTPYKSFTDVVQHYSTVRNQSRSISFRIVLDEYQNIKLNMPRMISSDIIQRYLHHYVHLIRNISARRGWGHTSRPSNRDNRSRRILPCYP